LLCVSGLLWSPSVVTIVVVVAAVAEEEEEEEEGEGEGEDTWFGAAAASGDNVDDEGGKPNNASIALARLTLDDTIVDVSDADADADRDADAAEAAMSNKWRCCLHSETSSTSADMPVAVSVADSVVMPDSVTVVVMEDSDIAIRLRKGRCERCAGGILAAAVAVVVVVSVSVSVSVPVSVPLIDDVICFRFLDSPLLLEIAVPVTVSDTHKDEDEEEEEEEEGWDVVVVFEVEEAEAEAEVEVEVVMPSLCSIFECIIVYQH
jgi:hypothetical protein